MFFFPEKLTQVPLAKTSPCNCLSTFGSQFFTSSPLCQLQSASSWASVSSLVQWEQQQEAG